MSKVRKGIKPTRRLVIDRPPAEGTYRRLMPFRRSWAVIAAAAIATGIFLMPLVPALQQAQFEWRQINSLFDLVGVLFISAWIMGWMMGPIMLGLTFVMVSAGREILLIEPGRCRLSLGIPGIGLQMGFDISKMRNLRLSKPLKKSGHSWRGSHLIFDYGANEFALGSAMTAADLENIRQKFSSIGGQAISDREATDEELQEPWPPQAATASKTTGKGDHDPVISKPKPIVSTSLAALLVANLVPVMGALLMDWRLSDVMVLYWAESAIIGGFNILKVIMVSRWFSILAVPFFIGHFGGFMVIHFLFLYGLFIEGPGELRGGDLNAVAQLFLALWPALVALLISHGVSFLQNFVRAGEYQTRDVKQLMSEPYSRVIFMHLVLIFGGGITLVIGASAPVLVGVIALKTLLDARAHIKLHATP